MNKFILAINGICYYYRWKYGRWHRKEISPYDKRYKCHVVCDWEVADRIVNAQIGKHVKV